MSKLALPISDSGQLEYANCHWLLDADGNRVAAVRSGAVDLFLVAVNSHEANQKEIEQLRAALRNAVRRDDSDAWMIPDTDGDADVDECFYCGKDEDYQVGQPFTHDPTCAGLVAVKLLTPKEQQP